MSYTRVLDHMDDLGITETFHGEEDGSFTIETKQDVTALLDLNKREFNDAPEFGRFKGDMRKVASIPLSVYFDLRKKGITDDPKAMSKWLNDPDNRLFLTTPGKF